MKQLKVTTVSSTQTISDLGDIVLTHPTTDRDLMLEFSVGDVSKSAVLQAKIDAGDITAKNEFGQTVTNVYDWLRYGTCWQFLQPDSLANLNSAISDANVDDASSPRTPTTHAASHESGADKIKVENLTTTSTNTAHVLKPNGSGGLVFGAPASSLTYGEHLYQFTLGTDNTWLDVNLNAQAGANKIVLIGIDSTSDGESAGVRQKGSSLNRIIGPKKGMSTWPTKTDGSGMIQAYAGNKGAITFWLLGVLN